MNRKLVVTSLAGAALAVGMVAGSIPAVGSSLGSKLIDGGNSTVTIDLPEGTTLPEVKAPSTPAVLPVCSDTIDNDGDGSLDHPEDTDCSSPLDDSEDASGEPGSENPTDAPGEGEKKKGGKKKDKNLLDETEIGEAERVLRKKPRKRKPSSPPSIRRSDGAPTRSNPSLSDTVFGPAPIGVPNFMIDRFRIPPFLLPIYQAAGIEYGVRWEILAAINEIETDYGRNLNVSSAGALGWMQFMPPTWKAYGVDANKDGRKDPYNPVDAIFSAARYLRAAGIDQSLRKAIFAYNHADWYVDSVLMRAKVIAGLPGDLVGSLSGLTQGHFPVAASARYADDLSERKALKRAKRGGNAANVIASSRTRRGINIYARRGAPVVAVNDGVVKKVGTSKRLGRYVILEDVYGNRYTYAGLGRVAKVHPVPKERKLTADDFKLVSPKRDRTPGKPASVKSAKREIGNDAAVRRAASAAAEKAVAANSEDSRERLYAYPERPNNVDRADLTGQLDEVLQTSLPGYTTFRAYFTNTFEFDRKTMAMKELRAGSRVVAGTVLGRIGKVKKGVAPNVHFEIRPAGRGAPRIDPKPILDGWKLLESTAIYRASDSNPFVGSKEKRLSVGQILLMSKESLERRVLADPRIEIYSCGRSDIRSGQIDRRVLATLSFLTESGFRPTVTSLKCGHGFYTKSGNVSHHSSGNAVDIASLNGQPVLGNQGPGSITEFAVKELLKLQGTMTPAQIITLMDLGRNTYAMADHHDHIHVGFRPTFGPNGKLGKDVARILKPAQWERLISRISEIENPTVRVRPSKYSLPARKRGSRRSSDAHIGE